MHAIESIIDTSRRSEKPVTAARGSETAARARARAATPALQPLPSSCTVHVTPMAPQASATALRTPGASRLDLQHRLYVGGYRGRPMAHEGVATATTFAHHHVTFQSVVVCLVGRRLVRQPRALLCFLSLSLYLSLFCHSLSLSLPPVLVAPPPASRSSYISNFFFGPSREPCGIRVRVTDLVASDLVEVMLPRDDPPPRDVLCAS